MATARPTLVATHRDITGKAVARLRHAGKLPAVVYGHGEGSDNVTVDAHEFDQLRRNTSSNTLIDLSVDGGKARPVLVNGVQVHPVNRRTLHVDLFLVKMTEELTVDVPLIATGIAPAVELLGGTLLHPTESVKVRALPDHLPESIEYIVESLVDFDTTMHVRDLTIPGVNRFGIGADITVHDTSQDLVEYYGSAKSYHVFLRWRPAATVPAHIH